MNQDGKEKNSLPAKRGRPSRRTIFNQFAVAADSLKKYGGLPSAGEAKEIWEDIWYVEAHNSTAIEGNTLVLREVKALLDQNRSVGGKELKDYLEVESYGRAAQWVYSQAQRTDIAGADGETVTITEIRQIHEQLVSTVWAVAPHANQLPDETAGGFRKHDILPFAGGMKPPPFSEIPSLMRTFADEANRVCHQIKSGTVSAENVPPRLAELHGSFERIHPFLDGNGRTGRLVLNLMLVRLGFPPAIIRKQRRNAYLTALDKADKGDVMPLAEIIARSVIDNVHRFITPAVAGPKKTVPLKSLATKEISYAALRQAATRGRLAATIGSDGIWYSSKDAVKKYLDGKHKRKEVRQ
ncbi:MAG: Fic family protein [Clostridiales Family XIII bacterium]|nr:Fic family protein [Clostridiales Family XIII bacterium]